MVLSDEEKQKFERWIIENVNDTIVPNDEGNGHALVFNLVHLLRGDESRYNYHPEQDAEIQSWEGRKRGAGE